MPESMFPQDFGSIEEIVAGNYKPITQGSYKICLTGPSGSGKTTLARIITQFLPQVKFLPGSADLIIDDGTRRFLESRFGYKPKGHAYVRALSASNPDFGLEFQRILLYNRARAIRNNLDFVTDRSPVDNFTYYLDQVAHSQSRETTEEFLGQAISAFNELTHLIYVKSVNPEGWVEDNGSRIANIWYQRKIDALFDYNLNHWFLNGHNDDVKVLTLDMWDLDVRTQCVKEFLLDE